MQITPVYKTKKFPEKKVSNTLINLLSACVAHYKMNDNAASTVVIDSRGFSNGTAQQNTEDVTVAGKVNGALTFNGVDDYVNTNNSFESTLQADWAINLWLNLNGVNLVGSFIFGSSDPPSNNEIVIFVNPAGEHKGKVTLNFYANSYQVAVVEPTPSFSDGDTDWKMITIIGNASTGYCDMYVNSIFRSTGTAAGVDFANYDNDLDFYIGARNTADVAANFWAGLIDNVMIFNKALDQDEVDLLWNGGRGTERLAGLLL